MRKNVDVDAQNYFDMRIVTLFIEVKSYNINTATLTAAVSTRKQPKLVELAASKKTHTTLTNRRVCTRDARIIKCLKYIKLTNTFKSDKNKCVCMYRSISFVHVSHSVTNDI